MSWNYDWNMVKAEIKQRYEGQLRKGEHIIIWEEKSEDIFGKSIKRANTGKIDLDIQLIPPLEKACTVCYHLADMGYSSRVGSKGGRKYVEIWLPRNT